MKINKIDTACVCGSDVFGEPVKAHPNGELDLPCLECGEVLEKVEPYLAGYSREEVEGLVA